MSRQMVTPVIDEVSGVDKPAHRVQGWLSMVKSESLDPTTATILATAEAIAKGVDAPVTKGNAPMPLDEEVIKSLPEDVQKHIRALEETVAKAEEKPEPTAPTTPEDEFAKAMAEMPEAVRVAFQKSQREAAEAKQLAKSLIDAQVNSELETVVKSLTHVPEVSDEFTSVLKSVREADPKAYEAITKALTASEAALKESALFKEAGSGAVAAEGSAQAKLEALAKELQTKDPELSDAMALAKAAEQNPDLYRQHRQEYVIAQREAV